jgi:hypothetical protein
MVGDLDSLAYLSWVVTAYLLTSTVVGPSMENSAISTLQIVLQVAISVFRWARLCGIAQSMLQLVLSRGEGIGGGGLIVTIAVIGDLIPPRARAYRASSARCSGSRPSSGRWSAASSSIT